MCDRMNNTLKSVVLLSLLAAASLLRGADFQAVAPSGQTIYFNIVQGGVEVTFPSSTIYPTEGWGSFTKPIGALTIPASVTYGGVTYAVKAVSNHAFYNCSGLTSVIVPEGVTAVRASAFRGCSAMTSISLPATLDSLYGFSLAYCSSLADVNVGGATPPVCLSNVFSNTTLSAATLHVPSGCLSSWSTAAPWSQFGNIVENVFSVTLTVTANDPSRGTVGGGGSYIVGTNVMLTATPANGFFFACWNDGDTLNPRVLTALENCSFVAVFAALRYDTVAAIVHDTITVHDTVWSVEVQEDTVYLYDTVVVTTTDTVYISDTVMPTFFRLTVATDGGGVGIGNGMLPAGAVAEIGALPLEGNRFLRWDDGSTDNPRTVTLTDNMDFTAQFEALGVELAAQEQEWSAAVEGRDIIVDGVQGRELRIYSADGRRIFDEYMQGNTIRFRCSAAGVYLLSVDGGAARKVIAK